MLKVPINDLITRSFNFQCFEIVSHFVIAIDHPLPEPGHALL